jgi:signal transduction histidine kinase
MIDHAEPRGEGARRVESAQRVAKGMLHEFRNILNPIVSAAYLMHANANDPVKVRELATRIEGFARAEDRVATKMRELLEREASRDHP